jgi:hypothetical protein
LLKFKVVDFHVLNNFSIQSFLFSMQILEKLSVKHSLTSLFSFSLPPLNYFCPARRAAAPHGTASLPATSRAKDDAPTSLH